MLDVLWCDVDLVVVCVQTLRFVQHSVSPLRGKRVAVLPSFVAEAPDARMAILPQVRVFVGPKSTDIVSRCELSALESACDVACGYVASETEANSVES